MTNVNDDLFYFLTHPHDWEGTDVILQKGDVISVLHYNPMLNRYYHYVRSPDRLKGARLGGYDLCTQLVTEGWVLENAPEKPPGNLWHS
jgi:hypothetical protein